MLLSLFFLVSVYLVYGDDCAAPVPSANFTNAMYEGMWYEIGKIQTPGGAAFQAGCVCDALNFHSDSEQYGDGEVTYTCRHKTPDGAFTNITADLSYGGTPGNFKEKFRFPFSPTTDYNLVYIDQDTAMEYDCGKTLGIVNYCIHFISRIPVMSDEKLSMLMDIADAMGLNTHRLEYKAIKQEGCW